MKKLVIGIMLVVAACAALTGFAASAAFTYQGVIKEVDGTTPANKNRTIEFRIYDGPTADTPLWGRAYSVLLDGNGLFNTALTDAAGSEINGVPSTGLASILAQNAGTTLYIGLTVDGSSGEISPRQALLAVPYAIHAADAAEASGDFTVEGQTTLKGGLVVTGGQVTVPALSATSLSVTGNISAGTAGAFSGYGTIPVGGIIMWSGSSVPEGWALCNGQKSNGVQTPNLCNRFIVGSGIEYNVGATGGAKEVTLTESQMPKHRHYYTGDDQLWSAHDGSYDIGLVGTVGGYDAKSETEGGARVYQTSRTGGNQAHENRPPYYALAFIMRVK